jgi:hypothetical protein
MRNNVKISYQLFLSKTNPLRQNPLYMKLYFNKKGTRISTGHYIHARDWDKKKKKVRGSTDEAHAINESLNSLRAQVIMVVNKLVLDGIPFNVHTIKDKLSGKEHKNITLLRACDLYLEMMKGLPLEYAKTTLIKYTNTKLCLSEFMKAKFNRADLYLYELDVDFIRGFELFLKQEFTNSQTTCYKHFQRFTAW